MAFFTKKFLDFFEELDKNNHKEWFDANRDWYEKDVKNPFKEFVTHLNAYVLKDNPTFNTNVSKNIFRINKDIRFSKDKTPYKTNVAAVFSKNGTKDVLPGFYIHFGLNELLIGGGMYQVEKENLAKIRQEIFYNNSAFEKVFQQKDFKKYYGEIHGEKNKVLPSEYKEFVQTQPYIANKQFYTMASVSKKELLAHDFDKIVLAHFKALQPLNDFLNIAIAED